MSYKWIGLGFGILWTLTSWAHSGRTAGDGCHFCRTNCEAYGYQAGSRHGHHGEVCDETLGPRDSKSPHARPISTPQPAAQSPQSNQNIFRQTAKIKDSSFCQRSLLPLEHQHSTVERVVDGDTIRVSGKKIRLLNINTEESKHPRKKLNTEFGRLTSDYVKELLTHQTVDLWCQAKPDRFGRELCYVFLNDQNINVRLVKEGWSPYYVKYGCSPEYHQEFLAAQAAAQQEKRGVWKEE